MPLMANTSTMARYKTRGGKTAKASRKNELSKKMIMCDQAKICLKAAFWLLSSRFFWMKKSTLVMRILGKVD
jgi:hypothetical protein